MGAAAYAAYNRSKPSSASHPPTLNGCVMDDSTARQKLGIELKQGLYAQWDIASMNPASQETLKKRLGIINGLLKTLFENTEAISVTKLHPTTKLALYAQKNNPSVTFEQHFRCAACFYFHKTIEDEGIDKALAEELDAARVFFADCN